MVNQRGIDFVKEPSPAGDSPNHKRQTEAISLVDPC